MPPGSSPNDHRRRQPATGHAMNSGALHALGRLLFDEIFHTACLQGGGVQTDNRSVTMMLCCSI